MNKEAFCHVFLSFKGETRNKFTCFLYEALKAEGFVAFMDNSGILVGDEVSSTIKQGIKNSMSAIIVFSQNYADSTWCLDELVLILERKKNSRYFIIPLFYEVEINDIKHQLKNYGRALEKHKARHNNKVDKWRQALVEIGDILGKHVEGQQSTFIQNTVKVFRDKLADMFPEFRLPEPKRSVLQSSSSSSLPRHDLYNDKVELVPSHLGRAEGRIAAPNFRLHEDWSSLYNMKPNAAADPCLLRRLVDSLQLSGITDLTQKSIALHEMVATSGGDPGESLEKMAMLLEKINDFNQAENTKTHSPVKESCSIQTATVYQKIPEDFRCPISLELMVDPVFVSTGQTYERTSIDKWIEAGHGTCPKTRQTLTSFSLTPNYVLRSLIERWCVDNGVEPPRQCSKPSKTASGPVERSKIDTLLNTLTSGNCEEQRFAAGEIRLLTRRNAHNRMAIAEAGAIPLLVDILKTKDSCTQEYAVTAFLNLSKCEDNKWSIVSCGAVPGIIYVLTEGSMKARKRAAATLSSLSVVDEIKVSIGDFGAIPPLVTLLTEGSLRGKEDAASALYNLCTYRGNKKKAVRAGIVPTLMKLLKEPDEQMVDESLSLLATLATHSEGRAAIVEANALPVLVAVLDDSGSPSINKENAGAVLEKICSADQQHLVGAQKLGLMSLLVDLVQNGTTKGKHKAGQLLKSIKQQI